MKMLIVVTPVLLLVLSGCGNSGSSTSATPMGEYGYGYDLLNTEGCTADESLNFSGIDDYCRGIGNEDFKWHCSREIRHKMFKRDCGSGAYTWDDTIADDGTVAVVDDGGGDHHKHHRDDDSN